MDFRYHFGSRFGDRERAYVQDSPLGKYPWDSPIHFNVEDSQGIPMLISHLAFLLEALKSLVLRLIIATILTLTVSILP